ncbi:MAG: response regulator transcription factor [Deltaproteobacteria bacterium]|nr:response regulator transcription factor [Deltaproteobacteria bacterium]MBW2049542.1 response regulator transcription factor [Deltaproteobacteria bacterium]MBW2112202.1 response regulator transcription factor [Deltaproteobacteria bacterium]MBW2354294.1 response regulator transcription factor [Deltaproteobacteria bacterium]HDZ90467.1 response regulator transcription factor [Deltaproteobacteria bacterium]
MGKSEVKIVLADDHTIVRQGLAKLLEGEPFFRVVGEAENGREAVGKVEELKPDVVIMDISMPMLNGIEATRQIRKSVPGTRVIVLSMHCHDRYIRELFRLGASGYLLKDSTGSDIVKAVHAAMAGNTYMSPSVSRLVIEDYVSSQKKSIREDLYSSLSNREREVFQMVAEGRSTREISEILFISPSTVKTHRARIMEKLRIENISQLIQFAIRIGIVDMEA